VSEYSYGPVLLGVVAAGLIGIRPVLDRRRPLPQDLRSAKV